ncbi:phage holin family protein [Vagococcus silagei]|uniref:Phage holin family protein n=1 Tax=Vagococcus silagei TaxID=2508885 RepID=A0A4S3B6N4_9ENTE|nr:phage holin family protein [Vagococcus silagei]THB62057.1 phage holin family protein [Vagococcus silagei]
MSALQRIVVNTLAFVSLSVMFPSKIYVSSIMIAVLASFVLALLNFLVRPILFVLSLPITIITLGLFSFVLNAVMLLMTSAIVGHYYFAFSSFGAALLISLIMSVINAIVSEHNASKYV